MNNIICIETHVLELRAELKNCTDPQERNMIRRELKDIAAINDSISETTLFERIESGIVADDPRIPF